MEKRKIEKIAAIAICTIIITLSFFKFDWSLVGVYPGCGIQGRLLYPLFHVNFLHAVLNSWCLLALIFTHRIKMPRMCLSYLIAVSAPINTVYNLFDCSMIPTVGLSGAIYFLFGSISFEVVKKIYYQSWMALYILVGFLFGGTNAWLHLYCYVVGFMIALINKPIKIKQS